MHNGCILCGGVGSGKSITSIAYFFLKNGGALDKGTCTKMPGTPPDLYIITTAKKRDSLEWEKDLALFGLGTDKSLYSHKLVIDSWNNISKYRSVKNSFFIFDEQRVVGSGTWVKSFIDISKTNEWVLLSATPGDKWEDYIPVFVANGFYKNRTDFIRKHIVYSRAVTFPKVERYLNTGRLIRLRNHVLVQMDFVNEIERKHINIYTDYDAVLYRRTLRERWNPYSNAPIQNISELCYTLRRIGNSDISRLKEVHRIVSEHGRAIIFYCFDYELELLLGHDFGAGVEKAEPQKMGAIQMTGVYAKGSLDSSVPLSNFSVPQHIVDKYANVNPPKGKPTQLVIADADYIPDKEYADVES